MDALETIGTLLAKSHTDETKVARIPLAVLDRFSEIESVTARLDAELELLRAQAKRQGTEIQQHSERIGNVEVDVNELQLRYSNAMRHFEHMRETSDALLDIFREQLEVEEG